MMIQNMNEESLVIERMIIDLKDLFPSLREIWLFGSRARGDFKKDSDWDLALLLDKKIIDVKQLRQKKSFFITHLKEVHGVDVNLQFFRFKRFYHTKKIRSTRLLRAIAIQQETLRRCEGFLGKHGLKRTEFKLRIIKHEGYPLFIKKKDHTKKEKEDKNDHASIA